MKKRKKNSNKKLNNEGKTTFTTQSRSHWRNKSKTKRRSLSL